MTAAGGWFCVRQRTPEYPLSEDAREGGYELPSSYSIEEPERRAEQSAVRIQINARPELDYRSGSCNLMLGNPEENTRNLRVSVALKETGELLYQSEVLLPGQRLAYVTLASIPEPGEYVATAIFTVIDEESGGAAGEVEAEIILTVSR